MCTTDPKHLVSLEESQTRRKTHWIDLSEYQHLSWCLFHCWLAGSGEIGIGTAHCLADDDRKAVSRRLRQVTPRPRKLKLWGDPCRQLAMSQVPLTLFYTLRITSVIRAAGCTPLHACYFGGTLRLFILGKCTWYNVPSKNGSTTAKTHLH